MGYIRFALALAVALSHAGLWTPIDASYAVQIFFVISGYYMALTIEKYYKDDALRFYLNRALRIFPAYWIVAGVTLAFMLATDSRWPMNWIVRHFTEPVTILANVTIFGQDIIFNGAPQKLIVQPAWSVAMELCFYVLAPFLVRIPTYALIVTCAGLSWYAQERYFMPAQLCFFIGGILIYRTGFAIKRKSSLDSYLGDLSYPVYLIHYPVLFVFGISGVMGLAATLALSGLLLAITAPIEKARARIRATRSRQSSAPTTYYSEQPPA